MADDDVAFPTVQLLEVLFILRQWLDLAEVSDEIALTSLLVSETRMLVYRLRKDLDRERGRSAPSLTRTIHLRLDA